MSTVLDRAHLMFATAIAAIAGTQAFDLAEARRIGRRATRGWVSHYQHSRRTVAQDKRAARKARNVKRNKAHESS